jgi:hypothetical protein
MRVAFHQMKKGFPSFFDSSMKRIVSRVNSSSTVSMRFLFRGPVSSIFCVPSGLAQLWITPRVAYRLRISGSLK